MNWDPQYYIVYPTSMVEQIKWPEDWENTCNLPAMLREILNDEHIGSEFKMIWNNKHREEIISEYNVTAQQLEDYKMARCNILTFQLERTMLQATEVLKRMGAKKFICVDNYRDVILQQAYYRNSHNFKFHDVKNMQIIDFLNKKLTDEELSTLLYELMGFTMCGPEVEIWDRDGDVIDYQRIIGNSDIHIVKHVLYFKQVLDEEKGEFRGRYKLQDDFKKLLGLVPI